MLAYDDARALARGLADDDLSAPLWGQPVDLVRAILAERESRGILQSDPEPIGDPEYS